MVGGYGFDGGYGGYNYGAPSYNPPPGTWPGQPSFMNAHSGFGGGPFMQAPNGYGAPQMGGYLGPMQSSMNIPAGAMYNGRPVNSSNANSVFGSNAPARHSQQSASQPAPLQKSSTNGYSYSQGNPPSYSQQQPYVVPQPRGMLFEVHAWCSSSMRVPL